MADQPQRPTPMYVSYLTFANLLDWLRDLGTLPSQFDRSFWGSKFSGSGGAQLMAGLRFLGLLRGDTPDDRLEALALASNEERKNLFLAILKDAYGAEFIASLPKTTPKLVNDRLRELGTTDATHDKARSFFVNAAKAIGLHLPPQLAKQARNRPSVSRKGASSRRKTIEVEGQTGTQLADGGAAHKPPAAELPSGLHEALRPLLNDLVKDGPTWDSRQRARWKRTWDQTLDYAYPVEEEDQ